MGGVDHSDAVENQFRMRQAGEWRHGFQHSKEPETRGTTSQRSVITHKDVDEDESLEREWKPTAALTWDPHASLVHN